MLALYFDSAWFSISRSLYFSRSLLLDSSPIKSRFVSQPIGISLASAAPPPNYFLAWRIFAASLFFIFSFIYLRSMIRRWRYFDGVSCVLPPLLHAYILSITIISQLLRRQPPRLSPLSSFYHFYYEPLPQLKRRSSIRPKMIITVELSAFFTFYGALLTIAIDFASLGHFIAIPLAFRQRHGLSQHQVILQIFIEAARFSPRNTPYFLDYMITYFYTFDTPILTFRKPWSHDDR